MDSEVGMYNKCSVSVEGTYFKETFTDVCHKNKYSNSVVKIKTIQVIRAVII